MARDDCGLQACIAVRFSQNNFARLLCFEELKANTNFDEQTEHNIPVVPQSTARMEGMMTCKDRRCDKNLLSGPSFSEIVF